MTRTPPPGRNAWRDQTIDVIHPEDRGRGHQLPRPHTQQTWRPPGHPHPSWGKGEKGCPPRQTKTTRRNPAHMVHPDNPSLPRITGNHTHTTTQQERAPT